MLGKCLTCKHFYIWDGDPCCLEKDEWKIVLPDTEECTKHEEQDSKHPIDWERVWNDAKIDFFKRYTIADKLKEKYLKTHPEDKDIINK